MTDTEERRCAYIHLYGVAQACAMIALKRGEDAELATMAGMLHDFYSYAHMDTTDHAPKSAVMAIDILQDLLLAREDEIDAICSAIAVHSDKTTVHPSFSEVLVDADVLQHYLYNPTFEISGPRKIRYEKLKLEFGLK
jgi:HD superfamily phosphodiesterase